MGDEERNEDDLEAVLDYEAVAAVRDCFVAAAERDTQMGDKVEMVVLDADGTHRADFSVRGAAKHSAPRLVLPK